MVDKKRELPSLLYSALLYRGLNRDGLGLVWVFTGRLLGLLVGWSVQSSALYINQ